MEITDEMVKRLAELSNPTGGKHTPTPWHAHDSTGVRIETGIKLAADGFSVREADGELVALFARREDRDLALYFANTHAGIISLLRGNAAAWDFVERTGHVTADFAKAQAENARAYADLFCRLGKVEPQQEPA
jgi:hypothetical protein